MNLFGKIQFVTDNCLKKHKVQVNHFPDGKYLQTRLPLIIKDIIVEFKRQVINNISKVYHFGDYAFDHVINVWDSSA